MWLFFFSCGCWCSAAAQPEGIGASTKKGTFYFGVGTHKSFYSKSDIALKSSGNPHFDFTLHNVKGKDDRLLNFGKGAPQYSYELGYFSHKKGWGIEFNFDHIKYYVRQFQTVVMEGSINDRSYRGDTLLTPAFIQLEHSDGGNYALLKWVKWQPLMQQKDGDNALHLLLEAGAGTVIPKTNVTIMGKHRDDRYKIAGYVFALESGLRYNFTRHLFAGAGAKTAFANYRSFLIKDGRGSQQWFGLHLMLMIGVQFQSS